MSFNTQKIPCEVGIKSRPRKKKGKAIVRRELIKQNMIHGKTLKPFTIYVDGKCENL